jgi:hypothetical protein
MAVTTIRPDADGAGVANFLKVGAAATKVAGLADDVDTTGIKKDGSLTGTQKCSFLFPNTVTLSATEKVRQVRLRVKVKTPDNTGKFDAQLGILLSGTSSYTTPIAVRGQFTTETLFTGAWYSTAPDGQEWTQSRLDGLRAQFSEYREDTFQATLNEVYIDIDVASQPTVNVTSPTSATDLSTATITIASPAVITNNAHGLPVGTPVFFTTTGALPTGLIENNVYYVTNPDTNTFNLSTTYANAVAETKINTTGTQSGTHTLFSMSVVSETSSPTLEWTYTDSDGDQQDYYQIKIFSFSQYTTIGFNPISSVPVYDSGEIASNDLSTGISDGTLLENGVYRVYIRAGKVIAGNILYSDWDYSQYVQDVAPPTVPTLTAVYDSNSNYVTLNATGASISGLGFDSQYFKIMRSDDGATNWVNVRDAVDVVPDGSFIVSVIDHEAPRGQSVLYRVHSVGVDGENLSVSNWSSSVSVSVTNDKTWWFKAVGDSDLNIGGVKVSNGTQEGFVESVAIFRPLGRTTPVVVAGYVYGDDGQYTITTISDSEFNSLVPILRHQGKLLVQDPYGTQKYVRLLSRSWQAGGTSGRRLRRISVDYVEIEAF